MDEMRDRRYLLLIPFGALLAILPLMITGSSCGHDFQFHLLNWLNVSSQWKQGVLLPHWDFTAAWNAGEPRYVFYPPLSWTIGALLGMVLPWVAVPNIFIWLILTACGFTMYLLARNWTTEGNALITGCFYMVHPYMLFTYFERSAFGELLASVWMPLLLLAILRPRLTISSIALPVTLLWLTNDPAAVMGCYTLAVLFLFRIIWMWRTSVSPGTILREISKIATGVCIGLALAGFYLVPAIAEQRWVKITMATVEGSRVQDNFLFGQFGSLSHRAILRTASLCSIMLLLLIAIFAVVSLHQRTRKTKGSELEYFRFSVFSVLLVSLVIGFLITAPSAFLWRHVPELKYLQFPWRFNAILGTGAAALLAMALSRIRLGYLNAALIALTIPLVSGIGGNALFHQSCSYENSMPGLVTHFYRGDVYDGRDEYLPSGSDSQAIGHANPSAWIADTASGQAPGNVPRNYSLALADRLHFDASSRVPAFFVINLRDYPAWRITINGILCTNHFHRPDGLIALPISSGISRIDITYALTSDQIIGWALTVLAAGALIAIWCMDRSRSEVFSGM